MSKFHIEESLVNKKQVYQIFIGGKAIGNPYGSRASAESYMKHLEENEARELDSGPGR